MRAHCAMALTGQKGAQPAATCVDGHAYCGEDVCSLVCATHCTSQAERP